MIEITKAYKTEDGQTFATIPEAQKHELEQMAAEPVSGTFIEVLIAKADKVIAILKLKPRKPRTSRVKKVKAVVALAK